MSGLELACRYVGHYYYIGPQNVIFLFKFKEVSHI